MSTNIRKLISYKFIRHKLLLILTFNFHDQWLKCPFYQNIYLHHLYNISIKIKKRKI